MGRPTISTPIARALLPMVQFLQTTFEQVHALADAHGVERAVHQALKQIERQIMELCIQDKAQQARQNNVQEGRGLQCEHGWAALQDQPAPRYAETVRGCVDYQRPVYRCLERVCQKECSPFDEELGLEPKEHYTPLMQ